MQNKLPVYTVNNYVSEILNKYKHKYTTVRYHEKSNVYEAFKRQDSNEPADRL